MTYEKLIEEMDIFSSMSEENDPYVKFDKNFLKIDDQLNPTGDKFRDFIISQLFTDYGQYDEWYDTAHETDFVIKMRNIYEIN